MLVSRNGKCNLKKTADNCRGWSGWEELITLVSDTALATNMGISDRLNPKSPLANGDG